ncbi:MULTISPECIES: type VII secretion protein EssA [Rossellomorea]|jgi:type VII secretion protein EssA|uniref:type VII secretion protein EssA n=1 Tax=Rossellomorea TaxID=2837508 RepID=UPI001653E0E4|nr:MULTISPECIES: type VII secretion protein EssA [Rossellomorea]MDT9026620.1 type VII secretion protein EssA [Rossellomorea sp. YC4-1]
MRGKILIQLILIGGIVSMFVPPISANTNINDLIPNDYQNNDFKKNTDLIHDQTLTNEKIKIPEEQKSLTFEGISINKLNELTDKLFKSEEKDTNTIKAKAENLKLFSESESARLGSLEERSQNGSSLPILIAVLVGICVLLLIIVIVIWSRSAQGSKG